MLGFIDKTIKALFGNKHEKDVKLLLPLVEQIKVEFAKLKDISNDALRAKTTEFKTRIADYVSEYDKQIAALREQAAGTADVEEKDRLFNEVDKLIKEKDTHLETALMEVLPEAFAVVKETARRFTEVGSLTVTANEIDRNIAAKHKHVTIVGDQATYANRWLAAGTEVVWNMVHYDVQLIGGIVLHQGKISEMATGEGKTLVATLPTYLNALAGQGVHIVTVNDYLSTRDSEWNAPLFNFLGLRVDCIDKHRPHSDERKNAYLADITYGTNNEFGFDYLRDNMVSFTDELVQRKLHYAIVDETDSVLIDDARTPLIISGQIENTENDEKLFYDLKPRIHKLVEAQKQIANKFLNEAKKLIAEGKSGEEEGGLALLRAYRALPRYTPLIKYLSEQGIRSVLQKTENRYLADNQKEMPKVDSELLFTIEEKNNSVELTEKGIDMITAAGEQKDFFIIPDVGGNIAEINKMNIGDKEKLAMKEKLMDDFYRKSELLHTITQLLKAYTLFEKDIQYVVMEDKVKIVDENTGRIMDGRRYSDGLHQAIEAKENVRVEASSQTLATVTLQNFFRMYHKLAGMTGTAETEAGEFWDIYKLDVVSIPTNKPMTRKDKDDLVYKTKKEKYNAIIDRITEYQNNGRPVLVGTTNVEVSELLGRMLTLRKVKHNVLNAKHHSREAEIVAEAGLPGTVTIATNMAGRGTDIKINDEIKSKGGLAIIGSERHEARRIDRQLRGRAGRQGDPGESVFFVSLEDDLMRIFGSDRIAKIMDTFGYKEGEVIEHSMITKSIERAQKKVEENHFGMRKRLLEYDDVMNAQREVIYKKRRNALYGERLGIDINHMFYDLSAAIASGNKQYDDYENFNLDAIRCFGMDTKITENDFKNNDANWLTRELYHEAQGVYAKKMNTLAIQLLPAFKDIRKNQANIVNIVVPYTDGKRVMQVLCKLDDAIATEGKSIVRDIEKSISLALIDEVWKKHLRDMDELKQNVQNASYEQKDPLLQYKIHAFDIFQDMMKGVNREVSIFLFRGMMPETQAENMKGTGQHQKSKLGRNVQTNHAAFENDDYAVSEADIVHETREKSKPEPIRVGPKIDRNDLCPCGSGKKYKKCHGLEE
ncbi:MAG: preprotein translocase subunit SecA [Chitinophagales bacterium]|nr:preprotein translocase subunit SecA [Chitinophagales bacterium]